MCNNCQLCLKYKKKKPLLVVWLPRGRTFNDTVSIHFNRPKTVDAANNIHILHMIDSVCQFSAGKIVKNKSKETIASAICCSWIVLFGKPKRFMADIGGEFANREYTELCERFNIILQYSAAESPFSNGMVESHHSMLAEMTIKTRIKVQLGNSSIMVLSAKNSLQMFGGFSSYQMLMGYNPTLPNN